MISKSKARELAAELEPVNGWLHFGGAIAAALALAISMAVLAPDGSARRLVALAIFGGTAVLMFSASALYHLAKGSPRVGLYRRLDHSMIFVFIAGSYTPICLIAMDGTRLGSILLATVWAIALLGILMKVFWIGAPRALSTMLYLAMGWTGVIAFPILRHVTPAAFLAWILVGGVLYSVGAFFYWRKWPLGRPGLFGFHELWHSFVIAAVACHYVAMLAYIAPLG
ncbi:MAG: PAQR family membrane homeostasis protein TrhA [Gemmatimonadaceae bacterium]